MITRYTFLSVEEFQRLVVLQDAGRDLYFFEIEYLLLYLVGDSNQLLVVEGVTLLNGGEFPGFVGHWEE